MSCEYEKDFVAWCYDQKNALAARDFEGIDFDNLREEIESVGRSEKNSLKSYLIVIMKHLLKLDMQPEYENKESWHTSVRNSRTHIQVILEASPSLRNFIDEFSLIVWEKAKREASKETGIDLSKFPEFRYTIEEIFYK